MKETFIIRTEWWDAISELNLNDQALIFRLLFEYHLGKPINNLNNLSVKLVWKLIEPNLQRNVEYYDKRRFTSIENGKKGGRPSKPKNNLKKPKKPLSDSDSDNNIKIDTNVSTKEKHFEDNSISLQTKISNISNRGSGQGVAESKTEESYIHPICLYIKKSCPNISKMKDPLTNEEAKRLEADFSKEGLLEIFQAMENYKDLNKKNNSVNLTLRNWITKRRRDGDKYFAMESSIKQKTKARDWYLNLPKDVKHMVDHQVKVLKRNPEDVYQEMAKPNEI
jgi:hypothetical protein